LGGGRTVVHRWRVLRGVGVARPRLGTGAFLVEPELEGAQRRLRRSEAPGVQTTPSPRLQVPARCRGPGERPEQAPVRADHRVEPAGFDRPRRAVGIVDKEGDASDLRPALEPVRRRGTDSNPRWPKGPYRLASPARSTSCATSTPRPPASLRLRSARHARTLAVTAVCRDFVRDSYRS
jgi:hypothetical protein